MKITVTPHRDEVTLQYDQANQRVTIKCDPCPTMSNELSKSVTLNLTDLPALIRGLEQVVNSTEINV